MKMRPQASNKQPLLPWQRECCDFKNGIFLHPPECLTAFKNLKGGWKFSFPISHLILTETCSQMLSPSSVCFREPGCWRWFVVWVLSSDKYSNPNEYTEKKSSHHYFFEVRINFLWSTQNYTLKSRKKIGVTKAVYSLYPIFCFILLSQV